MGVRLDYAREMLTDARQHFAENVRALSLEEALFAAGGYRSIIGVIKHMGGWVHVYLSYAFDQAPKHWNELFWPRDLRDQIELSPDYLSEVVAWVNHGLQAWDDALARADDDDLDRPHPLHWGATAPLGNIVVMVAHEVMYHTGELNMLLSIARGEAWEYTEEVEENYLSTYGHGVRGDWMNDEQAQRHEEALRIAHDARQTTRE